MIDFATLLVFASTLAVVSGSPGPSIAALVARVIARGPRSVLPFLAAMWIGEALWLTCAVFGLALLAQSFQLAFTALKWAGIAYLLLLAWKAWTAPVTEAPPLPEAGSSWRMFGAGLAVTLGNPKIMVFYLALLPSILDLAEVTLTGWLELTLVMAIVLIAVDLAWVLAATRARRLFRGPTGRRLANRLSAGMDGHRRHGDGHALASAQGHRMVRAHSGRAQPVRAHQATGKTERPLCRDSDLGLAGQMRLAFQCRDVANSGCGS